MTEEETALGRRAVACKGWRWMSGMLTHDGYRTAWSDDGMHQSFKWDGRESIGSTEQLIPDLSDPATLGCLLALVREAMNDEHAGVSWDLSGEEWVCDGEHVYNGKTYLGVFAQGPSYAEALVAALEAAREAAP